MSNWQRDWRPWRKIAAEYGIKGHWPAVAKRGSERRTAVILDIDGTLTSWSNKTGSVHKQGMAYAQKKHEEGHVLIIVTARDRESEGRRTKAWLRKNMPVPYIGPIMRSRSDMRHACDFKSAVVDSLSSLFDVVGAIDDDQWCLRMYRERGGIEVTEALPLAWSRTFNGDWLPKSMSTTSFTRTTDGACRLCGQRYGHAISCAQAGTRYDYGYDAIDWEEVDKLLDEFPSLRLNDAIDIIAEADEENSSIGDEDEKCRYCSEPEWDPGSKLCALHWDEYSGQQASG